ncbi:MAG: YicC/YloC family endoribonuclease, partial [Pseudomonadota bacterium]|nr:YicC/YloC family endoribonuclease [Pseudomonadota bacterium]
MVLSMTAFARTNFKKDTNSGFLEIRSLNHRHLDVSVKLPEIFRSFEENARELIKSRVTRGKIDCHLTIEIEQTTKNLLTIDKNTLFSLSALHKELSESFGSELGLNFVDILKWPNLLKVPGIHFESFSETLTELFNETLDDLLSAREREGIKIKQTLEE